MKASLPVVREEVSGFFHQWHPDEIDFKNRYGEESDTVRRVRARMEQGEARKRERSNIFVEYYLPARNTSWSTKTDRISRMELNPVRYRFWKRTASIGDLRADDMHAIRELERMRREGAEFIVFPWIAFWWLEYYGEFAEHLARSGRCLQRDELLTVYELHRPSVADTRQTSATC